MFRSVQLSKGIKSLLVFALLGVMLTSNAFAASADEKLEKLQQQVNGLESLVKDLSISVMNASKGLEAQATGLQPRIFNVENMVKDLSFDVKKTVAALADMQRHVGALIAQVEEFQPLVINLQSTVVKFGDKLDYMSGNMDKLTVGLANVTQFANEINMNLGGQIAVLNDQFSQLYGALSVMKGTVEANVTQLATTNTQVAALNEAVVALNVKVGANTETIYENHEAIQALGEYVGKAHTEGMEHMESLGMSVGTLDQRVSKLERAVDELNILGPTLASLRDTVAGLAARSDRTDARLGRLEDVAQQFANTAHAFEQVASLTQELSARLSALERQVQEMGGDDGSAYLAAAIADLQKQVDQLKGSMGNGAGSADLSDLKNKIGQLVLELESTKMELATLRTTVSSSEVTTIDKQQIVSEIRTEIRSELSDLTGIQDKIDEAIKKADAANGLALLALLAGVAAIALNLLL